MKRILRWVWRESRGEHPAMLLALIVGCARIAASLSFVWVSKCLVDMVTRRPVAPLSEVLTYIGLIIGVMLGELALSTIYTYICQRTEITFKNRLRARIYRHVLLTDYGGIRRRHSGEIINSLIEDTRLITDAVCRNLLDTILLLVQLAAAFLFLYWMSPMLAVSVLLIMPVALLMSRIYAKRMRAITARVREIDGNIQASTQEGVQHMVLVKAMRCIELISSRLDMEQDALYDETMHRIRFSAFSRVMVRIGFIAGYLTAFLWSIWHLYTGAITFGTMTAFLQLASRVQGPMASLSRYVPTLVQGTTSVDRLMALEDIDEEPSGADIKIQSPVGVRFVDVTFAYADEGEAVTDPTPVLEHFNCDFAPGTVNAICGITGIGKTTMVRLIMALLHPCKGRVELYNAERSVEASTRTRCNLTYVPQGNSLMYGTIRANLLLAAPDATEERMLQALHTAEADFVLDLPEGLDTMCGERGARLSEGQAQRIAIARALLNDAPVMLLDEFNSALDARTADTIMRRLRRQRPEATVILISHRAEVLEYCDQVVNMQ